MGDPAPSAPNVVPLRPTKAQKRRSEAKWGTSVIAQGYCIIPALLFRAQRRLGRSVTQLALILQIAEFWWEDGRLPWPKKETLADRLNISEKQVQRLVRDLETREYLRRVKRVTSHGQTSNAYDFSGLVARLQELAPEFAEAAAANRKVERLGGLRRRPAWSGRQRCSSTDKAPGFPDRAMRVRAHGAGPGGCGFDSRQR